MAPSLANRSVHESDAPWSAPHRLALRGNSGRSGATEIGENAVDEDFTGERS